MEQNRIYFGASLMQLSMYLICFVEIDHFKVHNLFSVIHIEIFPYDEIHHFIENEKLKWIVIDNKHITSSINMKVRAKLEPGTMTSCLTQKNFPQFSTEEDGE